MKNRRVILSIFMGAVLGVLCIIGVGTRIGFRGNQLFLAAMWYNRVILGVLVGVSHGLIIVYSDKNFLIRGFLLGLLVTTAITLTSEFLDPPSFFPGIAYGVIIDWGATKYG
jgi:hypothetical protein